MQFDNVIFYTYRNHSIYTDNTNILSAGLAVLYLQNN